MYLTSKSEGELPRQDCTFAPPLGPGMKDVSNVDRLEVWKTHFSDPSGALCEFRCFDKDGILFHTCRMER
jgi:hypothetical protein